MATSERPVRAFRLGGQHRVRPVRLRVGSVVGMWVVVTYFVLGIGLNAISRSRPERLAMVPVTVVLAVLSLLVASAGTG